MKRIIMIAVLMIVIICSLSGCRNNDAIPSVPDQPPAEDKEVVSEEHLLEMASSYWGFGTMNNWVMSADSGFFCVTREFDSAYPTVYPTWYDPDNLQKKDLNSEKLRPYLREYQLFTAGDRLIACTEDNSRINIIYPPYDEVSGTYQLTDDNEKIWYVCYMSAIVYDRAQDAVYCSVTDENYLDFDKCSLCRIDLKTGKVSLLPVNGVNEKYLLFGCYSDGLILMEGRNSNQKAHGQAVVLLYDLDIKDETYVGEELHVEKDEYSGYAFGSEKVYCVYNGKLMSYGYHDRKTMEAGALETDDIIFSQIPVDGRIHFSKRVSDDESGDSASTLWFDTNTQAWLTCESISKQLGTDPKYTPVFGMGYYGKQGKWYVIEVRYDISGKKTEYVFCEKENYWTGNCDFLRIEDEMEDKAH